MAAWTLMEAKAQLALWLEADRKLAAGLEYRIGTRSVTRAETAERLMFWKREVERLEGGRSRIRPVLVRDGF